VQALLPAPAPYASLPVQAFEPAAQQLEPLVPAVAPVTPVEVPTPLGNDIFFLDDEDEAAPLPPPTPADVEVVGEVLAYVSAPTGASVFTFGSGVRKFAKAAVDDAVAPPRLLPPSLATPPPSLHSSARRRLVALGRLLSPPSSSRGRHAGRWSPTELALADCISNGAAPGTWLPSASDGEDERGWSTSHRC
jgi:hypothetical protein